MPRIALAILSALFSLQLRAADKDPTYITAAEAAAKDPDFALQGEYVGDVNNEHFGVQIIALGNGKFHGVAYRGGLPGAGWDSSDKIEGDGERAAADGSVTMSGKNGDKAVIKAGKDMLEAPVKVETSNEKFPSTAIRYANDSGKSRIEEIRFGGTKSCALPFAGKATCQCKSSDHRHLLCRS